MNFAQPAWLALLALIPLLGIGAIVVARFKKRQWQEFAAPRLRPSLLRRSSPVPRWLALLFLLASSALLIIAIARPQGDAGTRTETAVGRNLMIALDLSRSMRVSDVKPDRLAQAKVVIYELLEAMPNDRIGFIGFAGDAYLYAPLTIDGSAVRETVEQIDETWSPKGGSDLAAAVHLATETLKKTGQKNNALVILSDGEEHAGDINAMISEAEKSGIYILAVGVGTEDGGFVPHKDFPNGQMVDREGRPVVSRLQPDIMRKLATETKGRFAIAGSGVDIPSLVRSVMADLDTFEMKGRERKVSIEFYQWLLLPAILFLIVSIVAGTRWRGLPAAALIAATFLMPTPASAGEASAAKAALQDEDFAKARAAYQALAEKSVGTPRATAYRLGEGISAYRGGQFREARTAFSRALLSEDPSIQTQAHLGLGNSLFQLGWLGLADEPYPADSSSLPDLNRFDTLVRERLAKLRESETPGEGESNDFSRIESMITNWTDATRHFDSASKKSPSDPAAAQNRQLTLTYLNRLNELLQQENEETQQAMPQSGQGEPKPGEGEEGSEENPQPKEGEGNGDEEKPGGKGGKQDDPQTPPKDGEKDDQKQPGDGKKPEESPKEGERNGQNPNESPEERARRILEENADAEKGPLTPGQVEFREPEKDW